MHASRPGLLVLAVVLIAGLAFLFWPTEAIPGAVQGAEAGGEAQPAQAQQRADGTADDQRAASNSGAHQPEREAVAGGPRFALTGQVLVQDDASIAGGTIEVFETTANARPLSMGTFLSLTGASPGRKSRNPFSQDFGDALGKTSIRKDGTFGFDALPSPHLVVRIQHPFYALHTPAVVHVGASRTADLVLRPYLGGLIRGRIQDFKVGGAKKVRLTAEVDPMSVMKDPQGFMASMGSAINRTAAVDPATGRFEFRAVLPSKSVRLSYRDNLQAAASRPVSILGGQTREVVMRAEPSGSAQITITGAGSPIPTAHVSLANKASTGPMAQRLDQIHGSADASGRCRIGGVHAGVYKVEVSKQGWISAQSEIEVHAGKTASLSLDLSRGGSVQGIVYDPEGQPIADVRVATLPEIDLPIVGDISKLTGEDMMLAGVRGSKVRTDAEGRFSLHGIDGEGTLSVGAWHPEYAGGMARGVRAGATEVVVRLAATAKIKGQVVDAATGQAVPNFDAAAMVTMAMVMERAMRSTEIEDSADGTFTLAQLTAGRASLRIRAPGYAEFRRRIQITAGETLDVGTLELAIGGTIRGTVRSPSGDPLAGITVGRKAKGMMDNPMLQAMLGSLSATTDRQGRFELAGIPPGRVVLKATSQEFASAVSKRLKLASGQVIEDVELILGEGGSIVGHLALSDGISPRGWIVMVNNQTGGSMRSADLGDDGKFRFTGIDSGRYEVQAMQASWMQSMQAEKMGMFQPGQSMDFGKLIGSMQDNMVRSRCKVVDGEETEVELDGSDIGESGVALSLRITLGDAPMPTGMVEVESSQDGRILHGFVSKGEASIGTVQPGTYRVRVRSGMTMAPVGEPIAIDVPKVETYQAPIRLAGGRIAGTVVDAETGEALSHAVVRIVSAAGAETDQAEEVGFAITAPDGTFSFAGLDDGRYSVFANDSFFNKGDAGHSGRLDGVEIAGGNEVRQIALRARQAAQAKVRVADHRDVPVAMAMLLAVDADGKPLSTLPSFTGRNGEATLGGLPNGGIRIVALSKQYCPGFSPTEDVQPGRATSFTVTLQPGPSVRVRVEDRAGKPIRGARMSVRWQGGPWIPVSLVQRYEPAFGGFALGHLPRGSLEFRVHGAGPKPFTVRRSIGAGTTVDLVFTAPGK